MVNGKCVKTLAEEFLFSGTSCVHLCKLKSSEKSVKNGYMVYVSMQWQWQDDRSANDGVLWLTGTKEGYIIQNIFSFYFFGSG